MKSPPSAPARLFGCLFIAMVVVAPLDPAWAQAETDISAATAALEPDDEAMLQQGVALRREGKDQQALELFRKVFQKTRSPRSRAQMGLAEQALGQWVEAEGDLESALTAVNHEWIRTNRAALEQALAVVKQRLGSLDILCNAPQTALWVDGRAIGTLPLSQPLRLTGGTVTVRVHAPGYSSVQRSISVTPGQLARETFQLMPLEPPPALPTTLAVSTNGTERSPAPAAAPRMGLHRGFFWATAAATLLTGGIAVWSGLDVLSANDGYKQNPTLTGYNDGRDREQRTNVLLGGTAALGIGTALLGLFATEF